MQTSAIKMYVHNLLIPWVMFRIAGGLVPAAIFPLDDAGFRRESVCDPDLRSADVAPLGLSSEDEPAIAFVAVFLVVAHLFAQTSAVRMKSLMDSWSVPRNGRRGRLGFLNSFKGILLSPDAVNAFRVRLYRFDHRSIIRPLNDCSLLYPLRTFSGEESMDEGLDLLWKTIHSRHPLKPMTWMPTTSSMPAF